MEEKSNIIFKRKLPSPEELKKEIPFSEEGRKVKEKRDKEIADIFKGKSNKFILIIGPCSADRENAVMDYIHRALERRNSMLYDANTWEEFMAIANQKPGFIKVNWCGDVSCEDKIKNETGYKSRCILEEESVDGPCICCGKEAKHKIYFGKQY